MMNRLTGTARRVSSYQLPDIIWWSWFGAKKARNHEAHRGFLFKMTRLNIHSSGYRKDLEVPIMKTGRRVVEIDTSSMSCQSTASRKKMQFDDLRGALMNLSVLAYGYSIFKGDERFMPEYHHTCFQTLYSCYSLIWNFHTAMYQIRCND